MRNYKKLLITVVLLMPNIVIVLLQGLEFFTISQGTADTIGYLVSPFILIASFYYWPVYLLFGFGENKLFVAECGFIIPRTLLISIIFTLIYGILFYTAIHIFAKRITKK